MKILVSGATKTLKAMAALSGDLIGHLQTPQTGNPIGSLLQSGLSWAVDNAAYSKPDDQKFWNLVVDTWDWMRYFPPDWVAVPDVVGNHEATLDKFYWWRELWEYEIGFVPVPLAYVLQNGAEIETVPWDDIVAVFIGGDDTFKLEGSVELIAHAKALGKLVHVGRVNSLKRLRWAYSVGADSVDGSGFSMFPEVKLTRAIKELRALDAQPQLGLVLSMDHVAEVAA